MSIFYTDYQNIFPLQDISDQSFDILTPKNPKLRYTRENFYIVLVHGCKAPFSWHQMRENLKLNTFFSTSI